MRALSTVCKFIMHAHLAHMTRLTAPSRMQHQAHSPMARREGAAGVVDMFACWSENCMQTGVGNAHPKLILLHAHSS